MTKTLPPSLLLPGLGFWICKEFAELLDGAIQIGSIPDEGLLLQSVFSRKI